VIHPTLEFFARANHASMKVGTRSCVIAIADYGGSLSRVRASISVRSKRAVLGVKRDVKSVLTDQQIIAGIGNIYPDEILFQARIDTAARTDELTPNQIRRLFLTVREGLKTAIAHGAGTEPFTERMPKGALLPERKKGGHWRRCRSPLKVFKVGGPTAYCYPQCQNC
jgi:formamidopyrimidine-DNA glycosylase